MPVTTHYINGACDVGDEMSSWHSIVNPATAQEVRRIPLARSGEVERAVTAARNALPTWARITVPERARILLTFREMLVRDAEELAALIVEETGKPILAARAEIARGLKSVEFACGAEHLLKGEFSFQTPLGTDRASMQQPLGVCVGITPFNFPLMIPLWIAPLALVCGNCLLLKPSEQAPSVCVRIAEMLAKAGVLPGVFSVVQGDSETAELLVTHPTVAGVSFVGSSQAGEQLYQSAIRNNKRAQALCGAKNHLVVMPDAPLDAVARQSVAAAFGSSGERCMAASVIVAVGDTGDELVPRLISHAKSLIVGAGIADESAQIGPLVTKSHLERVRAYIEQGIAEGAQLVLDGRDIHVSGYEDGFFLGPSIFDYVEKGMAVYTDEIFGPVLSVVRVPDFEAALTLANGHQYGNSATIFTNNPKFAHKFRNRVATGMVGINVPVPGPISFYGFGGWKRSGFGDIGMGGLEGLRFFTHRKTVVTRWPDG